MSTINSSELRQEINEGIDQDLEKEQEYMRKRQEVVTKQMEERSAKRQKMSTSTTTASSSGVSDFDDDSWLSEEVLKNVSKTEEEFTKSQTNSQAEKKEDSE